MADLTTILSISETVRINDHRFIGQTVSRNQRISTSQVQTVIPFAFSMKPMNYLLYSKNRDLLNTLRIADKQLEQYLQFKNTGWEHFIAYQGDMTSAEIEACEILTSSSGTNLIIGGIPVTVLDTDYMVRKGDYIQYGRYAYIATQDVLRGVESDVTIPVHRNILANSFANIGCVMGQYGTTINFGDGTFVGVTFPVVLRDYPDYNLVPYSNDSYIAWNGDFYAFENVV
jgi:hypothetical protein